MSPEEAAEAAEKLAAIRREGRAAELRARLREIVRVSTYDVDRAVAAVLVVATEAGEANVLRAERIARAALAFWFEPPVGKPPRVEAGQRWEHEGTPGLVHVVASVGSRGEDALEWAEFADDRGCAPAAHLLESARWRCLGAKGAGA